MFDGRAANTQRMAAGSPAGGYLTFIDKIAPLRDVHRQTGRVAGRYSTSIFVAARAPGTQYVAGLEDAEHVIQAG